MCFHRMLCAGWAGGVEKSIRARYGDARENVVGEGFAEMIKREHVLVCHRSIGRGTCVRED